METNRKGWEKKGVGGTRRGGGVGLEVECPLLDGQIRDRGLAVAVLPAQGDRRTVMAKRETQRTNSDEGKKDGGRRRRRRRELVEE